MLKEPAEFALWGEFSAGKLIFGAVMADELLSFSSSRACMFRSEAADLAVLEPEQPSLPIWSSPALSLSVLNWFGKVTAQ